MFAKKFKDLDIDIVAAPAIGGTLLSQWTAYFLFFFKKKEILAVYTVKNKGPTSTAAESEQIFRRGYDNYVKGKKVLVLEDLTTTGLSVKKTIAAVKNAGGKVISVGVMFNRDPKHITSEFIGAPFYALQEFVAQASRAEECPLCKKSVPINTKVGHGKEFLEKKKK
ncbi:phosphoribosyltransferase [Candidatus Roizmanbacteria bacterium]|nr:phosphoribosyltransferase [Candidatus Roizmanbacteria bacterium]